MMTLTIKKLSATIGLLLLMAALAAIPSWAQAAPGFDMVGFIQGATCNSPCSALSGGTITINGHVITVPANTIVQMPATALGWGEVFSLAPAGSVGSGLAIGESGIGTTYEAHVQGNIIGAQGTQEYRAGLIFISQQSLNAGQGFIDAIDYVNRQIHVNGKILTINDPTGRFSGGIPFSPDVRFTIDEDNPTIRTETAYPMCLAVSATDGINPATGQNVNALCPQSNRPKDSGGNYMMTFTSVMPGANTVGAVATPGPGTNAMYMAPFEVGDYINYAGVLQADGSISAYQIIANVGIYTLPGVDPAYVALDVLEQGTGAPANQAIGIEATSRVKVEGFSTDPSRTVDAYAIDNLCGTLTDRWWSTIAVDPGPPTGAKLGRFRFRPNGGAFLPPAREVRVRVTPASSCTVNGFPCPPTATEVATGNGLTAGQYFAPDFTFIFPETLAVGGPPASNNFGDFVWLVNGIGPWNGVATGQLSPWPDNITPTTTCTYTVPPAPVAPVASAVASPTTVFSGDVVTLDGTGSLAAPTDSYTWAQTAGPAVTISNANSVSALVVAPPVAVQTGLTFTLTVSNSAGSSTASTTVIVNPKPLPPVISSASGTPNPATVPSGSTPVTVSLNVVASDPNSPAQALSYSWVASAANPSAVALTGANTASASFQVSSTSLPGTYNFTVTVTNTSGLSSSAAVAVNVNAALTNPTITSISAPGPVGSGTANNLLSVVATGQTALTYAWKQTAGPVAIIANPSAASTTYTAPVIALGGLPATITFSVTVTDQNQLTATSQVTVTVNPPPDSIVITAAQYRVSKARLQVTVTDNVVSPNISVTCSIPVINPATGQNYTALGANQNNGTYLITFTGVPLPASVSCWSSAAPQNVVTLTSANFTVK